MKKGFILMIGVFGLSILTFGQTNNYFGGSGALNGSTWSTNPAGPFTSAFNNTDGGIANFNIAGSMTGGSITVAGINASASVTLSSPTGTISNQGNSVITIDVSAGITLDFGSQNFTTSGTAGYIKNGDGVLATGGSSTYGGGFTLNSGTMILNGVNAMGGGTGNTLSINGGTIAATGNRDLSTKYPDGITIGGNFTLGATTGLASSAANLTFNNNVSLGGATRTITIGGTGTYTFGGVTSNGGLTIESTAAGTIVLTGENTYTGLTTVSGGTLNLNRTDGGTLPGTNNITVNGGTLRISTNQTLNNLTIASGGTVTVESGATLTVNGTLNCGTNVISGTGTFTLSSGATLITANADGINSSGASGSVQTNTRNFDSGANYEFQGGATGTFSNTANNVTINSSGTVNLSQALSVTGTLTLTSGKLNLNGNNLTINNVSGPTWGISTDSYIIAEDGLVIKANPSTTIFPIGTASRYMPCRLSGGGTFNVSISDPTTGLDPNFTLSKQWNIDGDGNIDADFQWPAAVEGSGVAANRGFLYLYRYSASPWTSVAGPVAAGGSNPYTASLSSVTCCSNFAIGAEAALLPVELASFHARPQQNTVLLNWRTFSELNNDYFSIEKSTDGNRYHEIGQVSGQGTTYETTDYHFTDESPAPGINYYRLKQVDFDGGFEYSKVVSVRFDGNKGQALLYPTVASSEVQLRFPSPTGGEGFVQVFDLNGRLVKQFGFEAEIEGLTIATDELQSGQYLVKVQHGQMFEVLRFVKQ